MLLFSFYPLHVMRLGLVQSDVKIVVGALGVRMVIAYADILFTLIQDYSTFCLNNFNITLGVEL